MISRKEILQRILEEILESPPEGTLEQYRWKEEIFEPLNYGIKMAANKSRLEKQNE